MNCILMAIAGCSRKCYCNMRHYLTPIQHSPGFTVIKLLSTTFFVFLYSYSKLSNQNTAFTGYDILIEQYWSTKLIFEKVLWHKTWFCLLIGVMLNKDTETIFLKHLFDSIRIWTTNFYNLNWSRDDCILNLLCI